MSESRSNVEIEDVLSSIRRLVSQDGSHTPRVSVFRAPDPAVQRQQPATPAPEPECLVLTPSLRVPETPRAAAPEYTTLRHVGVEAPVPAASISGGPLWGESRDAAGEAPVSAAEPFAPADPTPKPDLDPETPPDITGMGDAEHEVMLDAVWSKPEDAAPDLSEELTRLEIAIAEMEVAVIASGEEFEPEQGHPFADEGLAPLAALHDVFDAETGADPIDEGIRAAPPEEITLPPEPEVATPEATISAVAEPEAFDWIDPVAPQRDELTAEDWAEDEGAAQHVDSHQADEAGPRRLHLAEATAEAPDPEARRSSYQDIRDEAESDSFDIDAPGLFDAADEAVVDEEALRALVSEIIRQELQGSLGERITRNVRKLVRREIQRALASRDFE